MKAIHKNEGVVLFDGTVWTRCGIRVRSVQVRGSWKAVTCENCLQLKRKKSCKGDGDRDESTS